MQAIIAERDRLRNEIAGPDGIDGGYATIAKVLGQSPESVLQSLSVKVTPRLTTLEKIQDALKKAKLMQEVRLAALKR